MDSSTINMFGFEEPIQKPKPIELTGKHLRAIDLYAKENDLRLTISTPPRIHFLKNNEIVTVDVDRILVFYDNHKKEAAKERARMRRSEKKSSEKAR